MPAAQLLKRYLEKRRYAKELARYNIAVRYHELVALGSRREHCLFHVSRVQRSDRRGTKAWIVDSQGTVFDSFFWWYHQLKAGDLIVVDAFGQGYGHHSRRSGVVYVGRKYPAKHGVLARMSSADVRTAVRYTASAEAFHQGQTL